MSAPLYNKLFVSFNSSMICSSAIPASAIAAASPSAPGALPARLLLLFKPDVEPCTLAIRSTSSLVDYSGCSKASSMDLYGRSPGGRCTGFSHPFLPAAPAPDASCCSMPVMPAAGMLSICRSRSHSRARSWGVRSLTSSWLSLPRNLLLMN